VPDDPSITLVLGGARSGKSAFAQALASQRAGPVLFVATGVAVDAEMEERIAAHRAARPASWRCVEAPVRVGEAIQRSGNALGVVLVDCLSFLVSNLLTSVEESSPQPAERTLWPSISDEIGKLLAAARARAAHLIVVSNEVGLSLVPEYPLGRAYRDLLGRANQQIAREADAVYLMVAGIPLDIKALGPQLGGP
jgi:adenosylcobinamide kinase / adenosylcobinamide-phosphate guanylyltransferase